MLPITALLVSVALLLAGSGLLSTLLAVRGKLEGYGDQTLGLIMSGYFVGFFLGTFAAPPLIRRVGHIRAFAFFAALAATTVLVYPIWLHPVGWMLLRIVTGVALVGLVIVIESWLNTQSAPGYRSRVFAGGRRLLKTRRLLHPARFHPMLRTTPTALELLPEIPDPSLKRGTP